MMVLITYDVDFSDSNGAKRLRKVAKICERYGVRVQNSVFEMLIDNVKLVEIKSKLDEVIDKEQDSVRFYLLGNRWNGKINVIGAEKSIKQDDTLIL